jgi:(hydroxyamino)benzene mutase
MSSRARLLIFAGMLLFLLGLFSGIAVQLFHNPRLAVSGHLLALMNGLFLMIVGAIWNRFNLSDRLRNIASTLVIFGGYANWILTLLGAAWGTHRLTPIAGAGFEALSWQEGAIMVGLGVMIVGMVSGVGLLTYGLRGSDIEGSSSRPG